MTEIIKLLEKESSELHEKLLINKDYQRLIEINNLIFKAKKVHLISIGDTLKPCKSKLISTKGK